MNERCHKKKAFTEAQIRLLLAADDAGGCLTYQQALAALGTSSTTTACNAALEALVKAGDMHILGFGASALYYLVRSADAAWSRRIGRSAPPSVPSHLSLRLQSIADDLGFVVADARSLGLPQPLIDCLSSVLGEVEKAKNLVK